MRVALFGGSGFVGSYLVKQLLQHGHKPVLLIRPGSEGKCEAADQCELIPGTITDETAIRATLEGCDAAVYLIGILREFPDRGITFEALQYQGAKRVIELAGECGVKRFLLMSANGVKADGTPYQRTKHQAEEFLSSTDLDWTIFRPSVIFGNPHGKSEFATELQEQMIKPPIPAALFYQGLIPRNAGRFTMSPIHVEDVATIFAESLAKAETIGQRYILCGPRTLEWREIIKLLAKVNGKTKLALPVSALMLRPVAAVLDGFEFFPITGDQLTMLLEGNSGDSSQVFETFGVQPTPFDEDGLSYLRG